MTIDQKLVGVTTIVECTYSGGLTSKGSGFFYTEISKEGTSPANKESGGAWHKIEEVWLITNRHVVLLKKKLDNGGEEELIPDSFTFCIREVIGGKIEWMPIKLSKNDLLTRMKLHPDKSVDVIAIPIEDLQTKLILENKNRKFIIAGDLSNNNLPSENPQTIEATSDIVVCSYPYDFYDKVNKFPIIKSGIVASAWGSYFNGRPVFLIDAQLFPGSSGGLVLSKPVDMVLKNGKIMTAKDKQYVFLGIYSSQYSHVVKDEEGCEHKESFGLGIVWYSDLIPFVINNGLSYKDMI
jgi:hypothetical protein